MRRSGGVTCWTISLSRKGSWAKWVKRRTCLQKCSSNRHLQSLVEGKRVHKCSSPKKMSKRSSNRPLHQKVRGKKCSRCLQSEVATELCEAYSKESAVYNVAFFGCSKPIPLLNVQNESPLFFLSRRPKSKRKPRMFRKRKSAKRLLWKHKKANPLLFNEMPPLPR